MADSKVVKAFRGRLKRNGYTDISICRSGGETLPGYSELYYVSVIEPLPSKQRLCFAVRESEMPGVLRKSLMKKGK